MNPPRLRCRTGHGAVVPVQKFCDVQKLHDAMTEGEIEYAGRLM